MDWAEFCIANELGLAKLNSYVFIYDFGPDAQNQLQLIQQQNGPMIAMVEFSTFKSRPNDENLLMGLVEPNLARSFA